MFFKRFNVLVILLYDSVMLYLLLNEVKVLILENGDIVWKEGDGLLRSLIPQEKEVLVLPQALLLDY